MIVRPVSTVWTRLLSFVLALAVVLFAVAPALATSIQTDLWVYQYGDTVSVSGDGFGANESVEVVTTDPYGVVVDDGTVPSDESGNIAYSFTLLSDVPGIYDVVATGLSSGLTASTQFDPPNFGATFTSGGISPSSVNYSDDVTFSGQFTCTDNTGGAGNKCSSAYSGITVEIQLKISGVFTTVATVSGLSASFSTPCASACTSPWSVPWQAGKYGATSVPPGTYDVRAVITGLASGPISTPGITGGLTLTKEGSNTTYTGSTSGTEGTSLALSAHVEDLDGGVGAGKGVYSPDSNLAGTNVVTFQLRNAADTSDVGAPVTASIDQSGNTTGSPTLTLPAAGTYKLRTSYAGNTFYSASGPDIDTIMVNPADITAPDVTINQATGQADPTNSSPINFSVVFSEPVTGFTGADVTLSGSAGATTATVTGSGSTYNVAVSGMTSDGTVIASIAAGGASDAAGNTNTASTSSDNTVTYDITAPSAPSITDSDPDSPANDNAPELKGTAEAGSTVRIYTNATCTSAVAAMGSANAFASPGLTATVGNDTTTNFYATATDAANNTSPCSSPALTYVEDSTAPAVVISFPTSGSYTAFTWNAGCGTAFVGDFCGTALDVGGSGVATVRYSIRQGTGNYWDGVSFGSASEVFLTPTGLTSWSQAFAYSNFLAAGDYTIRARATDVAGNEGVAAITFTINNPGGPYTFEGFFSPVDNPPILNQSKAGSAVPVKWRITQNGTPVSDPNSFVSLTSREVNCGTLETTGIDEIETYVGSSGLQYLGDGRWQFNWQTLKSYVGKCRIMTVTLNDGSTHDADFKFK
jgi:hypothetical protein